MAKKETVKKATANKTTKKVAAKKVEKVITEPIQTEEVADIESPELNYEEIYDKSEDTINNEDSTLDELIIMNEEEMVEKAKESVKVDKKENNERVSQRVDNIFGYLWNGQEMDY